MSNDPFLEVTETQECNLQSFNELLCENDIFRSGWKKCLKYSPTVRAMKKAIEHLLINPKRKDLRQQAYDAISAWEKEIGE